MKRLILVLHLLAIGLMPASANSDSVKIKTVKNMYNDATKANRNNQDFDTLRTLFRYSDSGLQNAIALAKFGRMSEDGMGMAKCHSAYETLGMNPSNGMTLDEIENINYRALGNGNVRASILYYGDVVGIRCFSLSCNSGNCKITDVFDNDGASGKRSAEKLCR